MIDYNKSNSEMLAEYRNNLESSINMGNFDSAMKWNDMIYEILFNLYVSAQSKYFKNLYSKELETTLKQSLLIKEELTGGFH